MAASRAPRRGKINAALTGNAEPREAELRAIIADAVAHASPPKWRQEVRARKTTVATGVGEVHGWKYIVRNWGSQECRVRECAWP